MEIRRSDERGHAQHGWLDSFHSFSFADYYDPEHMGFGPLRVINEDRVQAGQGFGTHGHRDMEIISYVLEGGLAHRDSMGNGSTLKPGDVQRMSAGTGVRHSEYNASDKEPVHFLQIWIEPAQSGLKPGYEQKTFAKEGRDGRLQRVASPDGRDGSLTIHQDAHLFLGDLRQGQQLTYALPSGRYAWVQVARGEVLLNGERLRAGDGAAIAEEQQLTFTTDGSGEVLLFDLA